MSVTQETAFLIETLARAASQIGSTAASAKINQLIVDILPATTVRSTEDALRQDNEALQLELTSLQKSADIMAENLALLRDRMGQINLLVSQEALTGSDIEQILTLSTPAAGPVEG